MTLRGRGLHHWPAGEMERQMQEERRQQIKAARKVADTEIRDGRKFKVLRLEDAYDEERPMDVEVRFHRHSVQLMHDLTQGPNPTRGEAA